MRTRLGLFLCFSLSIVATALITWNLARRGQAPGEIKVPEAGLPFPLGNAKSPAVITNVFSPPRFDWSRVESPDYVQYIANLRAIACPKQTINDIIVADVNSLFRERARRILADTNSVPPYEYWRPAKEQLARSQKKMAAKQQLLTLDNERIALLRRLLGSDVTAADLVTPRYFEVVDESTQFDFLSPEKQRAVAQIMLETEAEGRKRLKPGAQDQTALAELAKIHAERDAKLAALLTPQEKLDYEARHSLTASRLQRQLEGFNGSEHEFRELVRITKEAEDKYNPLVLATTPEQIRVQAQAEREMFAQMRIALGDERFADFQRVTDPGYQFLRNGFEGTGISNEKLVELYQVWSNAREQANAIRTKPDLTIADRNAGLQQIVGSTRTAMESVLAGDPAVSTLNTFGQRIYKGLESLETQGRFRPRSTSAVFFDK